MSSGLSLNTLYFWVYNEIFFLCLMVPNTTCWILMYQWGNFLTHSEIDSNETGWSRTNVKIRNGRPRPRSISNTFDPIALLRLISKGRDANQVPYLTAISPKPSLATNIEERASGTEVPAAIITRPIVKWPIWNIHPTCSTTVIIA